MKGKFTSADVRAIVAELIAIPGFIGSRVVNVYDISQKTYIFKFATASTSEKLMLLVDAGFRFHLTTFPRSLPDSPTPFTMILRKLRRKRLDSIRQLSFDRVVDLTFSGGDGIHHLIFEFYAGGNIVLTDENYEVQALLRSHQFADDIVLKVGELYPVAYATQLSVQTSPTNWNSEPTHAFYTYDTFIQFLKEKFQQFQALSNTATNAAITTATTGKSGSGNASSTGKKLKPWTLKQVLLSKESGISFLGPEFLDHAIASTNNLQKGKLDESFIAQFTEDHFQQLSHSVVQCLTNMQLLQHHNEGGYIFFKPPSKSTPIPAAVTPTGEQEDAPDNREYEDFSPLLLAQHRDVSPLDQQHFPTFNETVDTYFHHFEAQKMTRDLLAKEESLKKKLQNVQQEHENMLNSLTQQQQTLEESAVLLELHADAVDKVTLVINSALANNLSWQQIEDLVAMEQKKKNKIAMLVSRLQLQENMVIVKLPVDRAVDRDESESDSDEDNDGAKSHFLEIEVILSLTAHANVSRLYALKKAAAIKADKTIAASTRVLAQLQSQLDTQLKQLHANKHALGKGSSASNTAGNHHQMAVRKVHWFEKFHWFVTSEGFLVLSGRDAHQNDQLIRKHLKTEDVYVHADLAGAASCVVKARRTSVLQQYAAHNNAVTRQLAGDTKAKVPVPGAVSGVVDNQEKFFVTPLAIQEAGIFAVCRSRAWNAKMLTSAYWVTASQVSKTAPSGEYLSTGSFMIYGKKHYLPPMPLEMGFGVLFRIADDDYWQNGHVADRRVKSYYDSDNDGDNDNLPDDATADNMTNKDGVDDRCETVSLASTVARSHQQEVLQGREERYGLSIAPVTTATAKTTSRRHREMLSPHRIEEENDDDGESQSITAETGGDIKATSAKTMGVGKGEGEEEAEEGQDESVEEDKDEKEDNAESEDEEQDEPETPEPYLPSHYNHQTKHKPHSSSHNNNKSHKHSQQANSKNNNVNVPESVSSKKSKTKSINKKKARRYAEQDDEDRELAMLVLGHASQRTGQTLQVQQQQQQQHATQQTRSKKQEQLGVSSLLSKNKQKNTHVISTVLPENPSDRSDDTTGMQEARVKQFVATHLSPSSTAVQQEWSVLLLGRKADSLTSEEDTVEAPLLAMEDLTDADMRSFASLPETTALRVLALFKEGLVSKLKQPFQPTENSSQSNNNANSGKNNDKNNAKNSKGKGKNNNNNKGNNTPSTAQTRSTAGVQNKSAFLAGIMRRVLRDTQETQPPPPAAVSQPAVSDVSAKRQAVRDENNDDEEDDEDEDERDNNSPSNNAVVEDWLTLVGTPSPTDKILYAVPICAPYLSLQHSHMKYKVKLTPGTVKKGKAAKTAIDLFLHMKEEVYPSLTMKNVRHNTVGGGGDQLSQEKGRALSVENKEKLAMKQLTDTELVSVIIGEVKLSMPGMQQQQQQMKKQQRNQKKQKNSNK